MSDCVFFSSALLAGLLFVQLCVCCQYNDKGLTEIPSDIPVGCTFINLQHNSITLLPTDAFSHVTQCTSLDLSNNKISMLQNHTFRELNNLIHLFLHNNQISVIQKRCFQWLGWYD